MKDIQNAKTFPFEWERSE